MARIRSIHPGIWTDEAFATLSMGARVLLFGIWTEADDQGVFEWKPVALKMRIFPADSVDIEPLLAELTTSNAVRGFSHGDRQYGLVRNFCKFQRPKKPKHKHVLPDELRTYAGLKQDSSPPAPTSEGESSVPVPHQYGTGTELCSQREEGGGRRKEEGKQESKKEEDPANAGLPPKFVFESGVIRLKQKDFDQWQRAFKHLNLMAELLSLSEWAAKQKSWFPAVSAALAKRDREVLQRMELSKQPPEVNRYVDPRL